MMICAATICTPQTVAQSVASIPATKVWTGEGPDFGTGDISPDGRYFSDINWNTGDIDLVDLRSGNVQSLTGQGYDQGGYAWMSSFSNDGKYLAFEWYNYDTWTHELRMYSFADQTVRTLVPASPDVYYLEPLAWSPDNQSLLLAVHTSGQPWEFQLLSISKGTRTTLITLDWPAPGGGHPQAYPSAEWSPDGRYIGYDYLSDEPDQSWNIYVLSPDGRTQSELVTGPGADRLLAWNKDGTAILFYSDRSGIPSLWQLSVANGLPVGSPRLISEHVYGIDPIGPTDQGYAFGLPSGTWNTYTAAIDFQTGKVLIPPEPVEDKYWRRKNIGDWSPDGTRLLYITFDALPRSEEKAVILSIDDELLREVTFPLNFHNKTGSVVWVSEDIVLLDGHTPAQSGVHEFNLQTGKVSMPADFGEVGFFQRFEAHPDGSAIYVEFRFSQPGIVAMDTGTGVHKRLLNARIQPGSLAISPDGRMLAFIRQTPESMLRSLEVVSSSGGDSRVIFRDHAERLAEPVEWTADGRGIITGCRQENRKGLQVIPVEQNGDPLFIDLPMAYGNILRVNPDGIHIAFQSGTANGTLYFLDDFR